jgi:hypothetical protein
MYASDQKHFLTEVLNSGKIGKWGLDPEGTKYVNYDRKTEEYYARLNEL